MVAHDAKPALNKSLGTLGHLVACARFFCARHSSSVYWWEALHPQSGLACMTLNLLLSKLAKMKCEKDKNCFPLFKWGISKAHVCSLSLQVVSSYQGKNITENSVYPTKGALTLQNNTRDLYNVIQNTAKSNYWPLQALLWLTVINKTTVAT